MCREGKADMALDLFMNARAEGIKSNVTICDSITGTCHQLDYLNQQVSLDSTSGLNPSRIKISWFLNDQFASSSYCEKYYAEGLNFIAPKKWRTPCLENK